MILTSALILTFLASFGGAAMMALAGNTTLYRVLAGTALVALLAYSAVQFGWEGVMAVILTVGVLVPIMVWLAVKATVGFTWRTVRQKFPAEPSGAPCSPIRLASIYHTAWHL